MLDRHRKAEEYAAEAALASERGETERAIRLYSDAADAERAALASLRLDQTRTRNVLSVSLASLLYKSQRFSEAERTIFQLLGGERLLPWAEHQLRELLEVVADEKLLVDELQRAYAGNSITLSLRGGEIGSGTGPLDLILDKATGFRNLLYRVAEWIGEYPLRMRGSPPKELTDLLHARVAEPAYGSYRFEVRLTSPAQPNFFETPGIEPREVTDTLFDFLSILNNRDGKALEELIPDPGYRMALLQLTRNVAPTGKRISEIGLYRGTASGSDAVYLTRQTVGIIREVLPQRTEERTPWTTVRGVLRALHLDQNWLELLLPDGTTQKCHTLPETLDDVVGPMVNHDVVVRGPRKRLRGGVTRVVVEDIELADEA